MLTALEINNFAIVSQLSSEWHPGMTSITGETGAGKSIAIDALSLCLGERAEASVVRPGTDKAQISAQFDIKNLPKAQKFLAENDLLSDGECLVRRVVNQNGRSKGYINGTPVTANQLKQLGQYLLAIHGQHAHQLLAKPDYQLQLLDEYAGHEHLLLTVKKLFQAYQTLNKEYKSLSDYQIEQQAQQQLLEYQVEELNEFSLAQNEFQEIEDEHNRLSHSQTLIESSQRELQALYEQDGSNAYAIVQQSANQFSELSGIDNTLAPIAELLFEASIQIEEAAIQIRHYNDNTEVNPSRLIEVEQRMSKALLLARKHHIEPNQLFDFHQSLVLKLEAISSGSERLDQLKVLMDDTIVQYTHAAKKLSDSRIKSANKLNKLICASMHDLSMAHGQFQISVDYTENTKPNSLGSNNVTFLVSTNPGQPLQPLVKVASGGELSRISLAIQVIIANKVTTPTLIFDEVDVGISGPTAASVGKLLRTLGESTQVICVTHLPQVASSGHQQFFVAKHTDGKQTQTQMIPLSSQERTDEIARLLGGNNISQATINNAQELLSAHI